MPTNAIGTVKSAQTTAEGAEKVTGTDIGSGASKKRGLDTIERAGILAGVTYDFGDLAQTSLTDTWTLRTGGSGGTITAVVVITFTASNKEVIDFFERTT